MKKRTELTVKEMRDRLVEVEKQIVAIESNRENITGKTSYLNGMGYEMAEIFGYAADSPSRYSHSFSFMMTDADMIDIQLDDLKRERDELTQKIADIEKGNESGQMGSY